MSDMRQNREQWPASYLNSWQAFSGDERSIKYLCSLFSFHIPSIEGKSFKVADIMSGSGKMGKALKTYIASRKGACSVNYIDASQTILDSIDLDVTQGDSVYPGDITSRTNIADNTFDIVVCRYGFNNLNKEDWTKALDEALRILRPGGIFFLQDHFIPGKVFSDLVNEAEQFLARMEQKKNTPFIFSTENFNDILDNHSLVESRIKSGYGLFVNIWDRLKSKHEILPDFEKAKQEILNFYKETCLDKYKIHIVDPEEYIHVFNITYAIVRKG